jgi:Outer membrane cobalamin receptor protein
MSIILLATSLNESYAADTLSTEKRIRLDSAEIVGNHMSPTRSAMSQTIFYNRKNEAAAPFQTLESVLRVSPSFDIRERGGKGIQTDISIRGGSFDQTMVMLNGINFTDARTGHQTHSLPIDIESIAGIDLIDGVSGTGAYAGAIISGLSHFIPNIYGQKL